MTQHPAPRPVQRVVFDTNTVVSALLFAGGRLNWLVAHWRSEDCVALASKPTLAEITRVLSYRKFRLEEIERLELLGEYLPYCQVVDSIAPCPIPCRDPKDQMFLDLAHSANADVLVTGDEDLLVLAPQTKFRIETPETYRQSLSAWH